MFKDVLDHAWSNKVIVLFLSPSNGHFIYVKLCQAKVGHKLTCYGYIMYLICKFPACMVRCKAIDRINIATVVHIQVNSVCVHVCVCVCVCVCVVISL